MASGGIANAKGVAIVLHHRWANRVNKFKAIDERIAYVDLDALGERLRLVTAYFPHGGYADEHVQRMYDIIATIKNEAAECKSHVLLAGDFNASTGACTENDNRKTTGPHAVQPENSRGQWLKNWATNHNFVIANTSFRKQEENLVTYVSPSKMERQIDNILIDRYLRSKLKDIYSSNDLDLGSDHKSLIARFGFSTSSTRRTRPSKKLKDTKIKWQAVDTNGYTEEVGRQLRDTELQSDITQRCEQIERVVIMAASDNQSNDLSQRRPQRSNELLNDLVMQRKMLDNKATNERSHLSKLIKKEIRIHKRLQRRTQMAGFSMDPKNSKTSVASRVEGKKSSFHQ